MEGEDIYNKNNQNEKTINKEELNQEKTDEEAKNEEEIFEYIVNEKRRLAREYRKEGHIYFVTEDRGNVIYIWDYTDKPDYEVEEFELPEETLKIAKEGAMLQYINGKYELYSSRGYDELFPESNKEKEENIVEDENNEDIEDIKENE